MFQTQGAPFRPLPDKIDPLILDKVETILSGKWSVEDVLEMGVDEMTTAAGVGNGLAKPIGTVGRFRNEQYEKMRKAFEEYLTRSGKESSRGTWEKFIEAYSPWLGEDMVEEFVGYLKGRGYAL